MNRTNCFVCEISSSKKNTIYVGKYWLIDTPFDIKLKGLFFIKTKRHVESIEKLTTHEAIELGKILVIASKKSQKLTKAKRIITWSLGLKDPHVHFWVVPVTEGNEKLIRDKISKAVKDFADYYRK